MLKSLHWISHTEWGSLSHSVHKAVSIQGFSLPQGIRPQDLAISVVYCEGNQYGMLLLPGLGLGSFGSWSSCSCGRVTGQPEAISGPEILSGLAGLRNHPSRQASPNDVSRSRGGADTRTGAVQSLESKASKCSLNFW
jgi:hypothetical protein